MNYDIIIAGGGLAGCAAACASARLGARTLLVERFGFLGGWATAALVAPFMPHKTSTGEVLVAGMFDEIKSRLAAMDGLLDNTFDPELMKQALLEMVVESGASLRLHTQIVSAKQDSEGFSLCLVSKSGMQDARCRRVVDCTGDGDVAAFLGAEFQMGDEQGLPQAMTLMFDMAGVDFAKALEYVRANPDHMRFPKLSPDEDLSKMARSVFGIAGYYELIKRARANGDYDVPGDLLFYINRPRQGEVVFNTTHVGNVSGIDADDVTRAEIEGRRQMMCVAKFARKYVPGFEDSYIIRTPAHIGVRETRRILGDYVFSEADVEEARKHEDAVCRLAYPVDVHHGSGSGYTHSEDKARHIEPPAGDYYEIPYRCLLPTGIENLLTAGRCVSSTQSGHGAIRIMPACAAMGQAAGAAAALSLAAGCTPRELDPVRLSEELRGQGALV